MSESQPLPPLPLPSILRAADNDKLGAINLSNITDHPYDTSLLSGPFRLPEGFNDVREAKSDSFSGWAPNTIVVGTFRFEVEAIERTVRLLAEATTPQTQHPAANLLARFSLGASAAWNAHELSSISRLGLRRFIGAVMITGARNHHSYEGMLDLHKIYALEKPFDGNYDRLEEKQVVLIEGKVSDYHPAIAGLGNENLAPKITVRQADRRPRIDINLTSSGKLEFGSAAVVAGNAYELAEPYPQRMPPYPLPSETIQITAAFHRLNIPEATEILRATSYNSAHLLHASTERMNIEQQIGHEIDTLFEEINTLSISAASKLFSHYVAGKIQEAPLDRPFILVDHLRQRFNAVLQEKRSPEDSIEDVQPLIVRAGTPEPTVLMQHLGTEVLHMNRKEFNDFALDVCYGNQILRNPAALDFLFGQLHHDPDTLIQSSNAIIWSFYDRYGFWTGDGEANNPSLEYASTLLRNGLKHLPPWPQRNAEPLSQLTLDLLRSDTAFPELRKLALAALTTSLAKCGHWLDPINNLPEPDNIARGIAAPGALAIYKESMPYIMTALEELNDRESWPSATGVVNKPYQHHIDQLQLLLAKLDEAPNREA